MTSNWFCTQTTFNTTWVNSVLVVQGTPINLYCTSVKQCFTRRNVVIAPSIYHCLPEKERPFVWSSRTWFVGFNYLQPSPRRFVRQIDMPSDLRHSATNPTMDHWRRSGSSWLSLSHSVTEYTACDDQVHFRHEWELALFTQRTSARLELMLMSIIHPFTYPNLFNSVAYL